jgi:hypothetical protein
MNGTIFLKSVVKTGNQYAINATFIDSSGVSLATDIETQDSLYFRNHAGLVKELTVTAIADSKFQDISLTATDLTGTAGYISLQTGALLRKTNLRSFPQFPSNIPPVILSHLADVFAKMVDALQFDASVNINLTLFASEAEVLAAYEAGSFPDNTLYALSNGTNNPEGALTVKLFKLSEINNS